MTRPLATSLAMYKGADMDSVTVVGAYPTRQAASHAVDALIAGGIASDQISVHDRNGKVGDLTSSENAIPAIADTSNIDRTDRPMTREDAVRRDASEGVPILGVAPVAAGGSSSDTMGTTAGGGYAGGLVGYLVSEGLSEEDARYHSDRAKAGQFIVTARTDTAHEAQARASLA